jgi:hypothetical protein
MSDGEEEMESETLVTKAPMDLFQVLSSGAVVGNEVAFHTYPELNIGSVTEWQGEDIARMGSLLTYGHEPRVMSNAMQFIRQRAGIFRHLTGVEKGVTDLLSDLKKEMPECTEDFMVNVGTAFSELEGIVKAPRSQILSTLFKVVGKMFAIGGKAAGAYGTAFKVAGGAFSTVGSLTSKKSSLHDVLTSLSMEFAPELFNLMEDGWAEAKDAINELVKDGSLIKTGSNGVREVK